MIRWTNPAIHLASLYLLGFRSNQAYRVCPTAPVEVVLYIVKIQVLMIKVTKHSSASNPLAYFSVFNSLVHQHPVVNPSLWWPVNAGYRHNKRQTCSQSVSFTPTSSDSRIDYVETRLLPWYPQSLFALCYLLSGTPPLPTLLLFRPAW